MRTRQRLRLAALLATLVVMLVAPTSAQAYLYWTNGTGIGRVNDDGTRADPNFASGASAFDVAVSSHVYWGVTAGAIGRANYDGSSSATFASPASAWGIDVDANYIYFANQSQSAIQRVDRATGLNQTHLAGAPNPRGVAVTDTHLFWTELNGRRIGRSNLDGSFLTANFIQLTAPNPTAIAVSANHIYWATRELGTIGRANLDGTGINESFITGAGFARGVAVDSTYVYWGTGGSIGRANLDGTNVNHGFVATPGITGVDWHPDTTPPVTTDAVAAGWQSAPVPVTLTGSDDSGSGFKATYYEQGANPAAPTTASAVYDPANKPMLGNGELLRYFSTDESGNAEPVRSTIAAMVDTQAPVTTDDVPSAPRTTPVTVTLVASDPGGSGVARTYYTTGTDPADPTTASAVYDPAAKPSLGRDELIKYFSTDALGHVEPVRRSATVTYSPFAISDARVSASCITTSVRDLSFRYSISSSARVTYSLQRRTVPRTRIPYRACPRTFVGSRVLTSFTTSSRRARTLPGGPQRIRLSQLTKVASLSPGVYRVRIHATPHSGMPPRTADIGFIVTAR